MTIEPEPSRTVVRWSTERKTQLAFACALACVVVIGVASALSLRQLTRDADWVTHAVTVLAALRRVDAGIAAAESDERDFLVTRSPADLSGFARAARATDRAYADLKRRTADDALERARVQRLAMLLTARLAALSRLIAQARTGGVAAARAEAIRARAHRDTADRLDRLIGRLRATERRVLARREAATGRRTVLAEATVASGGTLAFVIAALALLALRRDFAGRRRAEAAMRDLNTELETRVARRTAELADANAKLEAHLARLSLLGSITRAMGERQDVHSIYQVVIRALEAHLALDFCAIGVYEAAEERLTVTRVGTHGAALALGLAMGERASIAIDQNGLSRCVRGELVYEPDLGAIPFPFARRLAGGGLGALVAAPLRFESQVFGVLLAARREPHSFSSAECEFLRQLSEHTALAAHQAHLYQALQRAYEDLRQTQQAVLQQERLLSLGTMASGIAHDINNAISPIMLYTDMLLEYHDLPAETRKSLEVIQRAADQVAHTVARMREFYRPREPQQPLAPVDLNQLVAEAIDLTRARWNDMPQRRGALIELETTLERELPAVPGIASELRDALTNLVFNAVDAMPQGGRLSLRTRLLEPRAEPAAAPGLVQLEVADTGVGMDADTRRRCLEPFFTTKGERGTGLGLPMVYGTMQRHGGEVEVASAPGEGTRVTLSFPVARAGGGDETQSRPAQVVPPRRILLVDDDPIVLRSTRETLAGDGHRVTAADGGQAGIDAFRAAVAAGEPYHVVITDLGMPHVDGRQVAAAAKAARPDTLVLLLTGWGRRLVEEGEVPGCVDRVLSKPPRLRDLREALALGPDPG